MNKDEFYEYEDRAYLNPTLSSGEQEQFITNFRGIQDQNNAQINTQTHNLGTNIPSNLGGLGGGESYFNARYQTPQVDEMAAGLKTAAQAQALNDVMKNYQNQLSQRYNNAYRKYQKRKAAEARNLLNSPTANNYNTGTIKTESTAKTMDDIMSDELAQRNLTGKTSLQLMYELQDALDSRLNNNNNNNNNKTNSTVNKTFGNLFGDPFSQFKIGL